MLIFLADFIDTQFIDIEKSVTSEASGATLTPQMAVQKVPFGPKMVNLTGILI